MYFHDDEVLKNLLKFHDLKIYFGYDVGVLVDCLKIQVFKEK